MTSDSVRLTIKVQKKRNPKHNNERIRSLLITSSRRIMLENDKGKNKRHSNSYHLSLLTLISLNLLSN